MGRLASVLGGKILDHCLYGRGGFSRGTILTIPNSVVAGMLFRTALMMNFDDITIQWQESFLQCVGERGKDD